MGMYTGLHSVRSSAGGDPSGGKLLFYPPISFSAYPFQGCRGRWSLSQLTWGGYPRDRWPVTG